MTELRYEPYFLPIADVGPENPLPAFRAPQANWEVDCEKNNIPPEDQAGLGWETGFRVLPYRMQDGYTRQRRLRHLNTMVLENEYLKVTVLPEFGGKVASIYHKQQERELIYRNPVFQPGNLALRNAWTSGGIEWNTGQLGHHYLACSPVHCVRVECPDGDPVLRLYAWQRVKRYAYQIDLHLPSGSPFFFAHVRIINPHDYEIPMYWWTNIGMVEQDGGRVLTPADTTYHGMTVYDCPYINGLDYSYATRIRRSYDLFFRIPSEHRPWEAYIDKNGKGFVHTSTWRLRGRKMFAWGMGQGGRRWGEYLAAPDMPHLEIQAGLAYTQTHSVAMPANTQWTWTEAMGAFDSNPALTHSSNWQEAYGEAERVLEKMLPQQSVDELDVKMNQIMTQMPEGMLFRGDGWGALEKRRMEDQGEEWKIPPELPFTNDDLTEDQAPWLELLESGALPEVDPQLEPGQFQIHDEWRDLLEESILDGQGNHWLAWYHLGVMRMESGDTEGARLAWETSLERTQNAWALRNLSVIESRAGNNEKAADLLAKAVQTGPVVPSLVSEYVNLLIRLKRYSEVEILLQSIPENVKETERLQMAAAWVALHFNRFDEVEEVLRRDFATIQEGELTLSELWFALQEKKLALTEGIEIDDDLKARVRSEMTPPYEIDFRMSYEGDDAYIPPQAAGSNQ